MEEESLQIDEIDLDEELVKFLDKNALKLFSNFGVDNELSNDPIKLSNENLGSSFKLVKYTKQNYSIQLALEKAKITLSNVQATIADEYRNNKHSSRGKLLEKKEMEDKINLDERYIKQAFKVKKLECLLDASEVLLGMVKYRNSQIENQIKLIQMINPMY